MSSSDESFEDERIIAPRQRVFRLRTVITDPTQFRERFRLTPRQADVLLSLLGEQLEPSTFRSNAMSAKEKLLCALRFYSSNAFSTLWDMLKILKTHHPTVCGAVDGTLIKLAFCPSEHESQFVDRHQQHSINSMNINDLLILLLDQEFPRKEFSLICHIFICARRDLFTLDYEIKGEKLRKLKLENRLLELSIYEKEVQLGFPPELTIFAFNEKSAEEDDPTGMEENSFVDMW
uniref:Uncharacterized protein n=1 Tax=Ditylenchus dipsaci TaxID=166011 RepID=A0A915DQH9_9BILA